jgi:hypothetical protein
LANIGKENLPPLLASNGTPRTLRVNRLPPKNNKVKITRYVH